MTDKTERGYRNFNVPAPPFLEGINITDLITGVDQGTALITGGVAFGAVTPIDFTGTAVQDDLVLCSWSALNSLVLSRNLEIYSDAAGTLKLIPTIGFVGAGTGQTITKTGWVLVRVGDPAASVFYKWDFQPTGAGVGLDMFAVLVLSNATLNWTPP